jgi:hypothetical protein
MNCGLLQWLKPIILATWKVEIQRIVIQGLPGKKTSFSTNGWTGW